MISSRFSRDCVASVLIGLTFILEPGTATAQRALGTDVSNYQGSGVNWSALKTDNIVFAWAKATEGTDFIDADFTINESNAKAAKVPIGAYDFAHPEANTPAAEAQYFWNEAGSYILADGLTVQPMLDYETFTGTIQGASTYSQWANLWCSNIVSYAAAKGVKVVPVIYVGPCNTESYLNSSVSNWLNNIAVYPGNPQTGNPWSSSSCTSDPAWSGKWNVWQYGDTNWSGGDSDVFNGTSNQALSTLLAVVLVPSAPAGATIYWDPGAKKASPGSGGTGNWNSSTADWWYSGSSNVDWSPNGDNGIFAGTAGTVTLGTSMSAGSLTFQTAGYTIAGSGYTLTMTNPETFNVAPPGSSPVTIEPLVAGSAGYTVTGGGVLVFSNPSNTIAGTINIESNSTLVITTASALGYRAGTVNLTGGGILQNNDQTAGDAFISGNYGIALGTGGGILNVNTSGYLSYSGVISSSGSLTKTGSGGTLILGGANTYTGATVISAGTLTLGASGSINDTSEIVIDAGATLDVSSNASWTLSKPLVVSGTGTTLGSTAAAIKGTTNNGVNLGTQAVTMIFTPTSTNGDTTHPPLYISQGPLTASSSNILTISNASGFPLGVGKYRIAEATGGYNGLPNTNIIFQGAGIAAGTGAYYSTSNANLNIIVAYTTTTTLGAFAPSTYGQSVTFTATISPIPTGGTVQFYDNNVTLGSPVTLSGATASYSAATLPAGTNFINAVYSGTTNYLGSTSASTNQQVNAAPLGVTATAQSKVYGTQITFGSGNTNFTSSGLQNGETIGTVTLAVSGNGGASNAPVGTYTITPSAATGGTFNPIDYNISYFTNALTVTGPSNTIPVTITGVTLVSGNVQMNFSGTPGSVYVIEAATNLDSPITWTALSTNTADSNGLFNYTDSTASNFGARYYQTVAQ
jgi:autotransporter-associated beta strand protein